MIIRRSLLPHSQALFCFRNINTVGQLLQLGCAVKESLHFVKETIFVQYEVLAETGRTLRHQPGDC